MHLVNDRMACLLPLNVQMTTKHFGPGKGGGDAENCGGKC